MPPFTVHTAQRTGKIFTYSDGVEQPKGSRFLKRESSGGCDNWQVKESAKHPGAHFFFDPAGKAKSIWAAELFAPPPPPPKAASAPQEPPLPIAAKAEATAPSARPRSIGMRARSTGEKFARVVAPPRGRPRPPPARVVAPAGDEPAPAGKEQAPAGNEQAGPAGTEHAAPAANLTKWLQPGMNPELLPRPVEVIEDEAVPPSGGLSGMTEEDQVAEETARNLSALAAEDDLADALGAAMGESSSSGSKDAPTITKKATLHLPV